VGEKVEEKQAEISGMPSEVFDALCFHNALIHIHSRATAILFHYSFTLQGRANLVLNGTGMQSNMLYPLSTNFHPDDPCAA
jgi:hypothetical protein